MNQKKHFYRIVLASRAVSSTALAFAAVRLEDLPSRTDPSLLMVPSLRGGFPESLNVPIYKNIPLPDDRVLRLAMEWVKAHPDDPREADWTRQAGHNLGQVVRYMASLLGKTTDALLAGLVNALVDYVINHPVKDEKGEVFPSNHFHSPWAYPNIPEKWRTRKWYGKLHGIQEGYDGYVVWNPDLRLGVHKWSVDGRRQELFVNFTTRIYQVGAKRRKNGR